MPFTNPMLPGRTFDTLDDLNEAIRDIANQKNAIDSKEAQVVAKIIPASAESLERKVISLEKKIEKIKGDLQQALTSGALGAKATHNKEGLQIGIVLYGESRGNRYTLEVLEDGYLCSDGFIYDSLSGAALGVSGNRRSGWKFWKDTAGNSIGYLTGRFRRDATDTSLHS